MSRVLDIISKNLVISMCFCFLCGCFLTYFAVGQRNGNDCDLGLSSEDIDGDIVVDISGAVQDPGIYEVKSSMRVGELVNVAGGFNSNASSIWISKNLNLAQEISDAQKFYIPFEWDTYSEDTSNIVPLSSSENINSSDGNALTSVNNASVEDLDELPGIGPVNAQKIVDNRPYSSLEDFKEKSELNESTIEKIEDLISF